MVKLRPREGTKTPPAGNIWFGGVKGVGPEIGFGTSFGWTDEVLFSREREDIFKKALFGVEVKDLQAS